jgi:hypothetical protein
MEILTESVNVVNRQSSRTDLLFSLSPFDKKPIVQIAGSISKTEIIDGFYFCTLSTSIFGSYRLDFTKASYVPRLNEPFLISLRNWERKPRLTEFFWFFEPKSLNDDRSNLLPHTERTFLLRNLGNYSVSSFFKTKKIRVAVKSITFPRKKQNFCFPSMGLDGFFLPRRFQSLMRGRHLGFRIPTWLTGSTLLPLSNYFHVQWSILRLPSVATDCSRFWVTYKMLLFLRSICLMNPRRNRRRARISLVKLHKNRTLREVTSGLVVGSASSVYFNMLTSFLVPSWRLNSLSLFITRCVLFKPTRKASSYSPFLHQSRFLLQKSVKPAKPWFSPLVRSFTAKRRVRFSAFKKLRKLRFS